MTLQVNLRVDKEKSCTRLTVPQGHIVKIFIICESESPGHN